MNSYPSTSGPQRPQPATPSLPPSISASTPRVGAGIGSKKGGAPIIPTLQPPLLHAPATSPLVAGIDDEEVRRHLSKMPCGTLGSDFTQGLPGFRHLPEPAPREGEIPPHPFHYLLPGVLLAHHPTRGLICLAKQHIPSGALVGAMTGELVSADNFSTRLHSLDHGTRLHAMQTASPSGP